MKEYPQMTNTILNQILIKSDFQPPQFVNPQLQQQQQQSQANAAANSISISLTKEQKAGFIKSLLR
jgi:hypothetical protein